MADGFVRRAGLCLALSVGLGCSSKQAEPMTPENSGGTIEPANSAEVQALAMLSRLEPGVPTSVADLKFVAGPSYAAASGRTCRSVTLTKGKGAPSDRLACSDGRTWFFVPNVFVTQGEMAP